jgi:peptidoglycan hydrolase CwlO-like protein
LQDFKKISLAISAAACVAVLACFPSISSADERNEIQSELSSAVDELNSIADKVDKAKGEIEGLQREIDEKASKAQKKQEETLKLNEDRDRAVVSMYKNGGTVGLISMVFDNSKTFPELVSNTAYIGYVSDNASKLAQESKQARDDLEESVKKLDEKKTEQEKTVKELRDKRVELSQKVDDLKGKLDSAEIISRATTSLMSSKTFDTGDTTGWQSGVASAYGGYSDASVAPGARTATGDPVSETSMGVAVPMAWDGYSSLFGRKVEISYGGKSVIATVNDCGGMGGGSRSLDLQPGVFRAFGATNCFEWGLRNVRYRFL